MDKRNQIIDSTTIECTMLVVLSNTEIAILESPDLRDQIDRIAKDLHVTWSVEQTKNNTQAGISRLLGPISSSKEEHDLEIAATNFMSAIGKLTLPAFDTNEKKKEEEAWEGDSPEDELKFVKELKGDIDTIACSVLMPAGIPPIGIMLAADLGHIGHYCLERMINAYLEKYDKQ